MASIAKEENAVGVAWDAFQVVLVSAGPQLKGGRKEDLLLMEALKGSPLRPLLLQLIVVHQHLEHSLLSRLFNSRGSTLNPVVEVPRPDDNIVLPEGEQPGRLPGRQVRLVRQHLKRVRAS